MTAPAPDLRGRYHSALNSRRRSGTRHPSAIAIVEDKVAEEVLSHANPETNTSSWVSKASSLKMWPFTDGEGNTTIEPLVPAEDGLASNQQDARRNSSPKVDQQEPSRSLRSLRSSRSLSSLKLAAQPRGLRIPPGAAVSQSSEVCAQGEVTSTPLKADKCEQPPSEQTAQEHEHVPASANDMNPSPSHKDDVRNGTGDDPDLASTDSALEAASITSPAPADSKQSSSPTDVRDPGSQSAPIVKSTESEEPELPTAVEKMQPSTPKTLPEGGNEALIKSHAADDPPQNSSISALIPTIRVQQTTESDETAPRSELLAGENAESRPNEAPEKVLEAFTDSSHVPAPASMDTHMQHEAATPSPATPMLRSLATVPEKPGFETQSAADPLIDKVTDKSGSDHPGLAKLAIRKARNLAGSRFVLSILLGRVLADQTKPQLQELARPPIRRTAPVPGPSQVDGLAELEGDLESRCD